jgi:osmotically-inducible protein OsmY
LGVPKALLIEQLEHQLSDAGLQVTVEESPEENAIILTGVVDTAEAREAAGEIVATAVPDRRVDNQLEVETVLPTDVDDFVGDEPTAELESTAAGAELDADFTDQVELRDPVEAPGASSSEAEDPASGGDQVYSPPTDPVMTTDQHGRAQVLGGFGTEDRAPSEWMTDDEALADAVRERLREDAATADLPIVVAVRQQVVHLRGRVPGPEDAENAESVAASVPGVREVREELDVAGL